MAPAAEQQVVKNERRDHEKNAIEFFDATMDAANHCDWPCSIALFDAIKGAEIQMSTRILTVKSRL